ncbi:MAG: aspartate ammonia-lyase [Planctomycetaceae bacterium]|nr:aspartate ammonia-lyase [Planctomycetaceae bacterium]
MVPPKDASGEATRLERDTMGEMPVPVDALFGATTQRAVLNFPISGRPVPTEVIEAFAELKRACAEANGRLGVIPTPVAGLVVDACDELLQGLAGTHDRPLNWWLEQFPIDVYQTGSGTSTNMNVNEVVANLACLSAGNPLGSREPVHPNDHVNQGQSSNDTFPTAMQVAGAMAIERSLVPSLKRLQKGLAKKARRWDRVVKTGRTHLQDATPMRVGQEFSGFAAQIEESIIRAGRAIARLSGNLPIGGTAIGTGINTHPDFGDRVCGRLSKRLGIRFTEARNHFEAQATRDCVVEASGELRTIATSLSKIANDIRWLGSGPRCGLGELVLPATQPGSSIMPGKVNPVICESVIQVACQVVGHDTAITLGGFGGTGSLLQLNVAMPMMAWSFIDSVRMLANAAAILQDKCIDGLELDRTVVEGYVEQSLMNCTCLAPEIGYENAAAIAKEAHARGASIREIALERTDLEPDRLDALLDARSMTEPSAKGVSGPGRRKSASSGKSKKKTKKTNQKPTAKTKSAAGRKPSKESK